MTPAIPKPRFGQVSFLVMALLAMPAVYFVVSYAYLATWHDKAFLWNTLIHENGRLTLSGSLFYFDHFIACVPMITVFALCTAGGFALAGRVPPTFDRPRAASAAFTLLGAAVLIVLVAFIASIYTVGWQRTTDYALQRIERDGVMSKGGNWNQLQLSNVPIALSTIAVSSSLIMFAAGSDSKRNARLAAGGKICIGLAVALAVGISAVAFTGWQSFLNPRWMAHSLRELATYPLTGIPIALTSTLLVERYLSGVNRWVIKPRTSALILIGIGAAIATGQFLWVRNVDVLAIAQKPSFATNSLSVLYLLCSHVFEHFLDFVFIAPLTAGTYALVRMLAR